MVCLPSGMYYLVNKVVLPGSFSQIFCLSYLLNTSAFDFLNWRPLNFGTFGPAERERLWQSLWLSNPQVGG